MFDAGTRVRRMTDPGAVGIATGRHQERATYTAIEVMLPDGFAVWWREHQVEEAPVQIRREDAFADGRFGRVQDLRRTLMVERIRGDLTDVFYSMGTSDTDFYPHQFKPVLRFVESVTGRLLIADEVGLGKTIEALLIWKELEARDRARRLLVVCPALLREKWVDELRNRFRIRGEIANAAQVVEKTHDTIRNSTASFALVGGFEALRPPRNLSSRRGGPRSDFARLLDDHATQENGPLYDLVIIDEAHYARNHETATNRLVRSLNAAAANLVFLTATPIQLNDDNLFQILRMVDPDRFGDLDVFTRLLASNEPFVRAYRALLNPALGPDEVRTALVNAGAKTSKVQIITHALEEIEKLGNLPPDRRVALARSVERISVLATAMVRSRKRDVLQDRVIRDPKVIHITLTSEERRIYDAVTRSVIKQAGRLSDREIIGRFALITRQRQMASSVNAALRVIGDVNDVREELYEDFGDLAADTSDDDAVNPIESPTVKIGPGVVTPKGELPDSKLDALLTILRQRLAQDPDEKFVLFSYFRATLNYLAEKLKDTGITCHVLKGGMGDSKWETLRRFRDEKGPSILLSSEIGSEGVDLQFCRVLINYDLPWNPMKVEQRIGRLDRLGQEAERILIFNLVIDNTIEERMLLRLHERIGVFERSIGDSEQIIGEDVYKLVVDLFRDHLSDEERERRAELNIQAIVQRSHQMEELESQASNLVAFTDYILDEIRVGRDLGRFIEPVALWTFACELLSERYPGTQIEAIPGHESLWRLHLSSDAKSDLAQFTREGACSRSTRLADPGTIPIVTSDPRWKGTMRPTPEIIDATHPLILWLREIVKENPTFVYPVSAVQVRKQDVPGIQPGPYIYVVDRFSFKGLRREAKLSYGALDPEKGERLSARDAERLVNQASHHGETLPGTDLEAIVPHLIDPMRSLVDALDQEHAVEELRLAQENDSLCDRQLEAVLIRRDNVTSEIEARVALASQSTDPNLRRIIPLRQSELRKARERFDLQIRRIERSKAHLCDRYETAAGFIMVI